MKNSKKSIRKTIRFSSPVFKFVDGVANQNGLTFSNALKMLLGYMMLEIQDSNLSVKDISFSPKGLSDDDKKLLHKILVLYSRSSSNLNQSAHALNQMANLSWLDLNHDELMKKLNRIHYDLSSVDKDFNRYQDALNNLVENMNRGI